MSGHADLNRMGRDIEAEMQRGKMTTKEAARLLATSMEGWAEEQEALYNAMDIRNLWTTTKPTVPGWYWGWTGRVMALTMQSDRLLWLIAEEACLEWRIASPTVPTPPNRYTHFAPLTVPEPPEEDPGRRD